ncbi:hars-1 [Pristionchus pacificus]|uniref:histidine--tRNA ligase n=1 Tax=Pristionchus pacificus TaxID=54126 RepID=A0A2A6CBX5_PRIPA|nr:hars-1 [Pristionchus pacificus]|eukprot:PDM75600.1 hars-1 [Pristionchus pacificus]
MSAAVADSQLETLRDEIKQQGDEIRLLKANNADKDLIKEKVAAMNAKKALQKKLEGGDEAEKPGKFVLKCPKGTRDYGAKAMAVRESVLKIMTDTFKRHGAETIETPVFELRDVLLGKYGEEGGKLVYDLQDQGGELLSMRYDLTVPFARFLAMNKVSAMKRYHIARVYRRDQPVMTRGRYREFYQCDFDIAGTYDSMIPEAECLKIMDEVLDALDLGEYTIKLNHRLMLDGMFAVIGSDDSQFKSVCASVDKLDKEPWEKVEKELINERGLTPDAAARLGSFVRFRELNPDLDNVAVLDQMMLIPELAANAKFKKGVEEIKLLLTYCTAFGVSNAVRVEPSLARGLDYYTGSIYEAVIPNGLPGVADDEGQPVGVGSVAGGGRYDGLVGMFAAKANVPCCGVSFGIERLFAIIEAKNTAEQAAIRTSSTQVFVASAQKNLLQQELKDGVVKLRNTQSREETTVKLDELESTLTRMLAA